MDKYYSLESTNFQLHKLSNRMVKLVNFSNALSVQEKSKHCQQKKLKMKYKI